MTSTAISIGSLPQVHDRDVNWRDSAANRILDLDHPVIEALVTLYEHYFSNAQFRQHYAPLLANVASSSEDILKSALHINKPKIIIQKAGFPVGRYGEHRRNHFPDTILVNGFVSIT